MSVGVVDVSAHGVEPGGSRSVVGLLDVHHEQFAQMSEVPRTIANLENHFYGLLMTLIERKV